MLKILLSMLLLSSLAFASKPTGCDLSQVGEVNMSVGERSFKKVDYKAIAKTGKNFHSILVGSIVSIEDLKIEILDIKADKRVRGKPRTGILKVSLAIAKNRQNIKMHYSYEKNHFVAKGVEKNGKKVFFSLDIAAILCHAK